MKKRSILVVISCLLIGAAGCKQSNEKFISEGEIEYTATVIDQNNSMASMAPTKMIVAFKANKSCAEMTAGMGLFKAAFISDPEKKIFIQEVKILNKKFILIEGEEEIKKENDEFLVKLVPSKETKVIAGYVCKKVTVVPEDKTIQPFDVYYTDEVNIEDPNFTNPYHDIKGVLMEYQLKKFGLEMKFVAKSVKNVSVDDNCFQIPSDYKKVTHKEMKMIFDDLQ